MVWLEGGQGELEGACADQRLPLGYVPPPPTSPKRPSRSPTQSPSQTPPIAPPPRTPCFTCPLVFLEQGITSAVVYRFVENLLCCC